MDSENREREELCNRYSFLKKVINTTKETFYVYKKVDPNAIGDNIICLKNNFGSTVEFCSQQYFYYETTEKRTAFDFDAIIDKYIEDKNELIRTSNFSSVKKFIEYLLQKIGRSSEQLTYNVASSLLDHDNEKEATKQDICAVLSYINSYRGKLFDIDSNEKFYDKCYEKMIEYNYIAPISNFNILYKLNTFAYIKEYKTQEEQDKIKQIHYNYISQQLEKINETPKHLTIEIMGKAQNVYQGFSYYDLINCQLLENEEKNNFMLICLNNLDSHVETKLIALDLARNILKKENNFKWYRNYFKVNQNVYNKCVKLRYKAFAQANQDLSQRQKQIQK